MITCIREVRKAKNLTLQDVAERCDPPTTPQTVGRLETGTRTVSMAWLRRIADALGVLPSDLVQLPDRTDLPVVALLGPTGPIAPTKSRTIAPPVAEPGLIAMPISSGSGDYRAGDVLWLQRLAPDRFGVAINRDVLVPRPAGRFLFGRLIDRDAKDDGTSRLHLLPPGSGRRQTVIADAPWLAVVVRLIREL